MSHPLNIVAIDLGNSSGRVVLGKWDGTRGGVHEVYRFPNAYDVRDGHVVWDTGRIWSETLKGIRAARAEANGEVHCVGLDAWGAEYILIDRDGERVGEAFCLRDPRNLRAMEHAFTIVPRKRIYEITGIQVMPVNTLYGLIAHLQESPQEMKRAAAWLGTPEYYLFRMCGVSVAEWTNAPNSQMMDAFAKAWSHELCDAYGLQPSQCAPIVPTGTILGRLRPALASELGLPNTQVIAPACHDTGSAVGAIPHSHHNLAFISSGTWSLVGTVLKEPLVSNPGYQWNFTNEGGVGGTIRYLRNVIGLWLIQEVVHEWNEAGNPITAAQLADACMETDLDGPYFDISKEDPFLAPGGMVARINDALEANGFPRENRPAKLAEIIYRSLALRYAKVFEGLGLCTGKSIERVCIVGGGVKNEALNRLTALASGLEVVRGSSESTLLGNVAVQIGAMENTRSLEEIQNIAARLIFQGNSSYLRH